MFRVGQKVTLKDDSPWMVVDYQDEKFPEFGRVYTIRGIEPGGVYDTQTYIWLVEIRNALHDYGTGVGELNFDASEFRPIVSRKTSIEIFQRMLTPKQKELAR